MESRRPRGPALKFPPPGIYAGLFLGGLLIETVARFPLAWSERAEATLGTTGAVLVVAGFALMLAGVATFWRFGTSVLPFKPTAAFVRSGPYRFTRNPMYLGMAIVHAGVALTMNAGWPLVMLPLAMYLVVRLVIRVEEEYLGRAFGQEYADFKRTVRRWI